MLPKIPHFKETLPLDDDDECLKRATKLAGEVKPDWDTSALDFEVNIRVLCDT